MQTSSTATVTQASASIVMLQRRDGSSGSGTGLLPLLIILGVFVALAIAWFALSSCLGDNVRDRISERLKGLLFRRGRAGGGSGGQYGRMRDDPEATAFDIDMEDDDLYGDGDADADADGRPSTDQRYGRYD